MSYDVILYAMCKEIDELEPVEITSKDVVNKLVQQVRNNAKKSKTKQ